MTDRVAPYGITQLVTGQPRQQSDIATIKGNIARMIDQGAPEADIDAYVASEGVTPEQLRQREAMADQQGHGASFLQGALLGAGDEVVAGGAAALRTVYDPKTGDWFGGDYGGKYDEMLARERQGLEDFRSLHPYQASGLEAAGGVSTALVPAGAVVRGGNIVTKGAAGLGAGAVMGGAQGFGAGEGGFEQRLGGAGEGALWGAGAGLATPALGKMAGATWNAVAGALANRGVELQSIQKILGRLRDSGFSPQDAAARLDELGPEGVLADVNSGMQVSLGATASKDPGAAAMISDRLGGRLDRSHPRMSEDFDATLGPARDPYDVKQVESGVRSGVGDVYESTGGYVVDTAPVADFLQKEILRVGPRGPHGEALQKIRAIITDDNGNLVTRGDRVHAIREQLDMMAESAANSGNMKLAKAIGKYREGIDTALKHGVPGMKEADEVYTQSFRRQEAFDRGRRDVLTDRVTPGQHRANVARMAKTPDEQAFENAGVRYDLDRRLSNTRNNPGLAAERILTRDNNMQKIQTSIGPARADRLQRGLDREETFLETSNLGDVRRNSRTTPLKEAAADMWGNGYGFGGDLGAAVMGGYMGGSWMGALGAGAGVLAKKFGGAAGHAVSARTGKTIRQVADDLTATGARRTHLINALMREAAALPVRARNAETISRLAVALLLGTSGQTGSAAREAARAYGLVGR